MDRTGCNAQILLPAQQDLRCFHMFFCFISQVCCSLAKGSLALVPPCFRPIYSLGVDPRLCGLGKFATLTQMIDRSHLQPCFGGTLLQTDLLLGGWPGLLDFGKVAMLNQMIDRSHSYAFHMMLRLDKCHTGSILDIQMSSSFLDDTVPFQIFFWA